MLPSQQNQKSLGWWKDVSKRNALCQFSLSATAFIVAILLTGFMAGLHPAQAQQPLSSPSAYSNDIAITRAADAVAYLQTQLSDLRADFKADKQKTTDRLDALQSLVDQMSGMMHLVQFLMFIIGGIAAITGIMSYKANRSPSSPTK